MMLNYELYFNEKTVYYFKAKHIDDEELTEEISIELANHFKRLIPEKEIDYTFASVKDDSFYLFVSENVAFEIRDFLLENQALKDFKEITTDVLMNRVNDDEFHETFNDDNGFIYVLNTFIIENLTINMVLEKILEKGIDSLNEIDYQILQLIN